VNDVDLEAVAFHEAAHAVLHVVLGYELEFVSIAPDSETKSLGQTKGQILPPSLTPQRVRTGTPPLNGAEEKAMRDNVVNLLSGEVAEAHLRERKYRLDPLKQGNHTRDEKDALGQLQRLYAVGADYTDADRQLECCTAEAEHLIDENWEYVAGVARELLARTHLTGEDIRVLRP
jgi:hypothetical protein